jgi:hypothetical protein
MGRERKPGGHVLTRWHDRQPSPHPGGTPLDIGTPAGADGGGGRGKDAEPRIDPAISNLRPGQTLKVAVNLGRASNHVCTVQSRQVSDQMDNTFAASLPTTSGTSTFLPSFLPSFLPPSSTCYLAVCLATHIFPPLPVLALKKTSVDVPRPTTFSS